MPVIHVNTDAMRQLGQIFVQLNNQIQNQFGQQIQNQVSQLEGDWQGISRQRYEQLYQEWRTTITQAVQHGDDLGRHLQITSQQFENVDQHG